MEGIGSAAGLRGPQAPDRRIQPERLDRAAGADRPDRAGEAERSGHSNGPEGTQVARQEPAITAPTVDAMADASVAIPEGVDPELWSLLTTEERAHFARFAAMGGVTYGPESSAKKPFVRGQRLDLRI